MCDNIGAGFLYPSFQKGATTMDYNKIKDMFNTFLGFLTKLLVGLGVLESEDKTPYGEYINDFMGLADAVKDALDK